MGALSQEPRGGEGIRARGEEALGDLAQALIDNPVFSQALTTAIGAGERAASAQRSAMGALNIPAASDLERIEQRMRSLSARLEAVEDQLDDALDELAALRRRTDDRSPSPHPASDEVGAGQSSEG
jgi:chromosome segregation ATPase